jgi:hypothetical protein
MAKQVAELVTTAVTENLRDYADRGVFRNFSVIDLAKSPRATQLTDYQFNWLSEAAVKMRLDPLNGSLRIIDILPGIPYRSAMDKALREFIHQRCDAQLPDHRRLDNEQIKFRLSNRRQTVSITLEFDLDSAALAARSAVQLLHEIFNNFLQEGPYHNYMVEFFNEPEE